MGPRRCGASADQPRVQTGLSGPLGRVWWIAMSDVPVCTLGSRNERAAATQDAGVGKAIMGPGRLAEGRSWEKGMHLWRAVVLMRTANTRRGLGLFHISRFPDARGRRFAGQGWSCCCLRVECLGGVPGSARCRSVFGQCQSPRAWSVRLIRAAASRWRSGRQLRLEIRNRRGSRAGRREGWI